MISINSCTCINALLKIVIHFTSFFWSYLQARISNTLLKTIARAVSYTIRTFKFTPQKEAGAGLALQRGGGATRGPMQNFRTYKKK